MQKLLSFCLTAAILTLTSSSPNPPKELTVTLSIEQWNYVLEVINESKFHEKVLNTQSLIVPQLQRQLADTTKPKK